MSEKNASIDESGCAFYMQQKVMYASSPFASNSKWRLDKLQVWVS